MKASVTMLVYAAGLVAITGWGGQAMAAGACAQIRKACMDAGFVQGGVKAGNGLQGDCLAPLTQGTPQPRRATLPLPTIDPTTIAACKAENPDFGKGGATTAEAAMVDGSSASKAPEPPAPLPAGAARGPNIVFILADDFSLDLIADRVLADSMPNLMKMKSEGTTFANYFVTDSLCCPSRTSIFTGKFPHNTGVFRNQGPDGGFGAFMSHGNEPNTFAVALHAAGYQTAMLGKYLNGYEPAKHGVPAGWSEWDVDGSLGYREFNYLFNENGKLRKHAEYLTDEISALGRAFIQKAASGPFLIELASFAPHAPYTPPQRYQKEFPTLTYARSATFGARADSSAPDWLKQIPALTTADIEVIDTAFRNRVRSDKAIDDMIGDIRALLVKLGIAQNTYLVFSSDNGYHMGEYSLRPGKMTPLDTDIHVPLIIVGPGVAAGRTVDEIAENVDLCPTFTELAGTRAPEVDGHSLAALLKPQSASQPEPPWRKMALIEHHHPGADKADPDLPGAKSGNPPPYEALRSVDALYVEYRDATQEIGYYDLKADPLELHNAAATLSPAARKRWHEALQAGVECRGADACWKAQSTVP